MTRSILVQISVAIFLAASLRGQTKSDPNPKLGFQPAAVYSLNDIESINHTNGNLTLNIPLGALGPDRVGSSHGIGLIYNTKIWEPHVVDTPQAGAAQGVKPLNDAAWRYQMEYDLELSP